MVMKNERGAGRKPGLTPEQIAEIKKRRSRGEAVTALAKEYGVSRQTVSAYLNAPEDDGMENIYRTYKRWAILNREFRRNCQVQDYVLRMEYMCEDVLCSVILVDFQRQRVEVINKTDDVIHRAFGVKVKPDWEDFEYFLESRCFPRSRAMLKSVLRDLGLDCYDPLAIIEKTGGRMAEDKQWINLLYYRPTE
ncbi:MAG: Hin recombinase [Lachnospiraceae bacterium]|nr:Hin recombinase [Lachnospiraceae bacterium]